MPDAPKIVKAATDANSGSVIDSLAGQAKVDAILRERQQMQRTLRNHMFPIVDPVNAGDDVKDLPKEADVIDPSTGRPQRHVRYNRQVVKETESGKKKVFDTTVVHH